MKHQTSVQWRLTGTAALATFLTSLCLTPTMSEGNWNARVVAAIAVVAVVGGTCRQLTVPRWLTPVAQVLALTLTVTVMFAHDVAMLGFVPTVDVAKQFSELFSDGFRITWNEAPPITITPGVALIAVAGVAAIAIAVDALAVTWRHATLAGLPLFVLYLVPAAVLPEGVPWPLFALAATGWILLQLADGRDRLSRWGKLIGTDADATSGMHAVGGTGRRLGATALVAAIALPLVVPSLTDGVFGGGGTDPDAESPGGHSSSTFKQPVVKVTPLLDLKRNLTQGADTVLMRYETSDGYGQYLRIATLDEFDGDSWVPAQISAPETQQASQGLPAPPGLSSAVVTNPVTTQIHMAGLDTPQLPLPYPVSTVSIDGDWRWDANTFDVFTPAQDGTVQELLYSAEGLRVLPTADQLETAVSSGPTLTKYLALPQETKAMLTPITDRVTEGETTAYGRALALQNWFLKNFEYSIKTVPTDSESALRSFLHDKSGYCEQFAATMGLMARVAGIPSRLQVGFTPGTKTASGTWLVSAHDAHAWPELWFEGVGWVRFEPTPSAAAGGDGIATPAWAPPPVSVDNNQPGQNGQPGDPKNRPGDPRIRRPIDRQVPTELSRGLLPGSTATSTATEEGGTAWGGYAIAAMVLVALVAITPATAARLSRRRRWAHASDGRTAALAAWHDILDLATDLDLEPLATETPRDLATRLPRQGGLTKQDTADFRDLAQAVERTRYAAPEPQTVGGDVDASDVRRWRESSSRVCRGMREAVAPRDLRRATWWPASGRAAVAVWWGQSSQRIERAWGNAMQSLRRRVGRA